MARASVLGLQPAAQEAERVKYAKGPLTLIGMALAVFLGNVLTAVVFGLVYELLHH